LVDMVYFILPWFSVGFYHQILPWFLCIHCIPGNDQILVVGNDQILVVFFGSLPFIDPQVVSQTSSQWVPMTASWVSGASGDAPAPGETGWGMMGHYPQGLAGELRQGNGNAKSELTLIDSSRTHTCKKNPIITHTAYPTKEKVCLMMSDQTLHDGKTPHDLTSFHRNMFPSNPLHTLPVSLFWHLIYHFRDF
jgi:hypothetical protein